MNMLVLTLEQAEELRGDVSLIYAIDPLPLASSPVRYVLNPRLIDMAAYATIRERLMELPSRAISPDERP